MKENARLRSELNELRNSPELLLRKLPQELWLNILGYLKPGELCQVLFCTPVTVTYGPSPGWPGLSWPAAPEQGPLPLALPHPPGGRPGRHPDCAGPGGQVLSTTVRQADCRYFTVGAATWPESRSPPGMTQLRSWLPWRNTAPSSPPSLSSMCSVDHCTTAPVSQCSHCSYGQAQPLSGLIDQSLAKDRSMVKIACTILGRLGHL